MTEFESSHRVADVALAAERGRRLLLDCGFNLPRGEMVRTARDAARVAECLGFPVVLKVDSPRVIHKTEIGGVQTDLHTTKEVRDAFAHMMRRVSAALPGLSIEGLRVEEMRDGVEFLIGLENNAVFGSTITFGIGGILAEMFDDVAVRALPLTDADVASMLDEVRGKSFFEGFRGQPPVRRESVAQLIRRAAELGHALSGRLGSVDLNPIAVSGDTHCVLDAKFLLRPMTGLAPVLSPNTDGLARFFDARSVAVVGASATAGRVGNSIVQSLSKQGYAGSVFPVNRQRAEIAGLRAYPSLSAIPEEVELVVAAIPLDGIPEVIAEMGSRGSGNLVIVSAGGKEVGEGGRELERLIAEAARDAHVRVIGPNCIGVFNAKNRLDTFFQTPDRMRRAEHGSVALITQSGTVGAAFLERAQGFGVSKIISYGNRLDVDDADLVSFLGGDSDTRVIACYVEGLVEGRKFLEAVRTVARSKRVVVYKAGRTRVAAQASLSHTGFFGGTYAPWRGLLRQAGAVAVDSFEELLAVAKALSMQPRARGRRVAMISNGAGPMVQAMDLFPEGSLAELEPATVEKMRAHYPASFSVRNPVDVTGSGTAEDYAFGIESLLSDPHVDVVLPWFVFQDTALGEEVVAELARLQATHRKPIVAGAVGGEYTEHMRRELESRGIPVLQSVREWVTAALALGSGAAGEEG